MRSSTSPWLILEVAAGATLPTCFLGPTLLPRPSWIPGGDSGRWIPADHQRPMTGLKDPPTLQPFPHVCTGPGFIVGTLTVKVGLCVLSVNLSLTPWLAQTSSDEEAAGTHRRRLGHAWAQLPIADDWVMHGPDCPSPTTGSCMGPTAHRRRLGHSDYCG